MASFDSLDLGETLRGFRPGQRLFGRFVLRRMLGRGGMGVVWLARDDQLDEEVALKFIGENIVHDAAAIDDLKAETSRARKLSHPHIVDVHEFWEEAHIAAVSMEFVDGRDLSQPRQPPVVQPQQQHARQSQRQQRLSLCRGGGRGVGSEGA